MRVWITRAEPGATRTARAVADLGHEPRVCPVLEIARLSPALPETRVLAFTSANAVAAHAALAKRRDAAVFAVGEATARAARAHGFQDVRSADGDGAALARLLAEARPTGPVLWPRAAEPAFDLAEALEGRVEVVGVAVYEARPRAVTPPPDFDLVLIHSPRAARALAEALDHSLAEGRAAAAISFAGARPLTGLPFRRVAVADRPTEAALLAALGKAAPGV